MFSKHGILVLMASDKNWHCTVTCHRILVDSGTVSRLLLCSMCAALRPTSIGQKESGRWRKKSATASASREHAE